MDNEDQAQLIKQLNEKLLPIKSQKDFDQLKSLSVFAVLHGNPTDFPDNFLTFSFIVSMGSRISNNK